MNIRDYLKNNKIISDGAFGTYFAKKYKTDLLPELFNITDSGKVVDIHREYIDSGSKLIRTNTFASNTVTLNCGIEEVKDNIRRAVQNAKVAAEGRDVFIAGSIGPIPDIGTLSKEEIQNQYNEIACVFLDEGINILDFETFSDPDEISDVINRIGEKYHPFIIAGFSVNQYGYSNSGRKAAGIISESAKIKCLDAVGFNCGVGPLHMKKIIGGLNLNIGKFIIAAPNAGYPKIVRNRVVFSENYGYFAKKLCDTVKMGVDIFGGCCGTTPDFIRELKAVCSIEQKPKFILSKNDDFQKENIVRNNAFYLSSSGKPMNRKLLAVELAPPVDADDKKILDAARLLSDIGVDVVTFPDSPSGRTRIDSVLMAQKVKNETELCVMPHICCRDKNAIAMRSTILGAAVNGIYNLLIVTGDPIPSMARQTVKSVFNFDSVGMMKLVQDMNSQELVQTPLVFGGAVNYGRNHIENEIKRVKKKMEIGASFFLTQPIFSEEDARKVRLIKQETNARILAGIMPLVSRKNALFMKNEIAGVDVPDYVVDMYPENSDREAGEQVGITLAKSVMKWTEDFADGYYFSFPFNRVYMLKKILG